MKDNRTMVRKPREVLDRTVLGMLHQIQPLYGTDNRDLFLDIVMYHLIEEFGRGELLEYLSMSFRAKNDNVDHQTVAELIDKAIEAIPESSEFNLFGDEKSPSIKKKFGRVWNIAKDNELAALEWIRKYQVKAKNAQEREMIQDMLTIIIARRYQIDEDLKWLYKKYDVKNLGVPKHERRP